MDGRRVGGRALGRPTLHGGPVVLRLVRVTPSYNQYALVNNDYFFFVVYSGPVRAPGLQSALICLLISAPYKVFVCLHNFLPYILLLLFFPAYLFASLLVYFFTYLSTSSRILEVV